jgi:hypothetical protein
LKAIAILQKHDADMLTASIASLTTGTTKPTTLARTVAPSPNEPEGGQGEAGDTTAAPAENTGDTTKGVGSDVGSGVSSDDAAVSDTVTVTDTSGSGGGESPSNRAAVPVATLVAGLLIAFQ